MVERSLAQRAFRLVFSSSFSSVNSSYAFLASEMLAWKAEGLLIEVLANSALQLIT